MLKIHDSMYCGEGVVSMEPWLIYIRTTPFGLLPVEPKGKDMCERKAFF